MYSKYSILFAEDFDGQYNNIADKLSVYGIRSVFCKNSGIEIQINILNNKPSVVVMNFCLLDYDAVLQLISQGYNDGYSPVYYNIYTYDDSERLSKLEAIGIDINIPAPFNSEAIAGHLKLLCENMPVNEFEFRDMVRSYVAGILNRLCISASRVGWGYIIDAVMIILFERSRRLNLSTVIYPRIAKNKCVTPESVERAIRVSVETAWKNSGSEIKSELFPAKEPASSKPTNSEFLMSLADNIYDEYRELFDKYYKNVRN